MDNLASTLITIMTSHLELAFFISIILNVIIAIFGLLPSFFITVANIVVFGPLWGLIVSICGEALGAIVSFLLYRKGFKEISQDLVQKNKYVQQIMSTTGSKSRKLIFSFRLMPYMPSGIVTYAAAISQVSLIDFTLASTTGKVPALVIEAIISIGLIKTASTRINLALAIISIVFIIYVLSSILKNKNQP